jgi:hypothetical protein
MHHKYRNLQQKDVRRRLLPTSFEEHHGGTQCGGQEWTAPHTWKKLMS